MVNPEPMSFERSALSSLNTSLVSRMGKADTNNRFTYAEITKLVFQSKTILTLTMVLT
jgi:hypothetical protein